MNTSDSSRELVERDPRNDPRRSQNDESAVDRGPIVADRARSENENAWPAAPADRRRSERRRIERTGTDI